MPDLRYLEDMKTKGTFSGKQGSKQDSPSAKKEADVKSYGLRERKEPEEIEEVPTSLAKDLKLTEGSVISRVYRTPRMGLAPSSDGLCRTTDQDSPLGDSLPDQKAVLQRDLTAELMRLHSDMVAVEVTMGFAMASLAKLMKVGDFNHTSHPIPRRDDGDKKPGGQTRV